MPDERLTKLGSSGTDRGKADPATARPADSSSAAGPPAPNRLWADWDLCVDRVLRALSPTLYRRRLAGDGHLSMVLDDRASKPIWTRQQEGVLDSKTLVHHGIGSGSERLRYPTVGWSAGRKPGDNALAGDDNGLQDRAETRQALAVHRDAITARSTGFNHRRLYRSTGGDVLASRGCFTRHQRPAAG